MAIQVYWTPRGGSTPVTLALDSLGHVFRLQGRPRPMGYESVSVGRKKVRVNYESFFTYEIEVRHIKDY